ARDELPQHGGLADPLRQLPQQLRGPEDGDQDEQEGLDGHAIALDRRCDQRHRSILVRGSVPVPGGPGHRRRAPSRPPRPTTPLNTTRAARVAVPGSDPPEVTRRAYGGESDARGSRSCLADLARREAT